MLDKKYNHLEKESQWNNYWNENKIYEFKLNDKTIYSIDTPPPTVSGNIHIGHMFSYIQTEMISRYKRISGYNVFYPFGFDDNGLPTERLVEKERNIKAKDVSREEFSKLCVETSEKYEENYRNLFKRIGVSADFNLLYQTASPTTTKISQLSFLDLYNKDKVCHKEEPALWCNDCITSIAQAELETKELQTTFNYINFETTEGEEFTIATTRPELLCAIVTVFINPKDEKNKHLIGKTAKIPLINVEVPIMADEKADPEKGTGIVMCCTFGDTTDIEWWHKYNLPLKEALTQDGYLTSIAGKYEGLKPKEARTKIVEDLKELGKLIKQEELTHEVQVHERCHKEIEYKVQKQWFIKVLENKEKFLELGNEIKWYPAHMKARYTEWVKNLQWDWNISRQRYFGVPFPVWYCKKCGNIKTATEEELPVNPLTNNPKTPCECGSTNFIPETDVMDTWATSSVTPLINMKYKEKDNFEEILKPMDLRPNAHDIIRTWDFYTIVKSYYHFGQIPWRNIMISGFIMAGKGEKISKSKNNAMVDPNKLMDEYSADVIRYWAGSGKLGTDMLYNEETLLRGKKLINKIWNVSKFIEMHLEDYKDKEIKKYEYIDRWIIAKYQEMEKNYINYLEKYEVGLALNILEKFFWNFCDNYIEIVKHRLYRPEEFGEEERYSGQKTIYTLLYKLLQDFSIFFPYITEEIYQGIYKKEPSIHLTKIEKLNYEFTNEKKYGDKLIEIISQARGTKTNNNVSLKTPIKNLDLSVNKEINDALTESMQDFKATLFIKKLNIKEDNENYKIEKIELEI